MVVKFSTICVSDTVKAKLQEAKAEYKRHHPELENFRISDNTIIIQLLKWYDIEFNEEE